jgi:starvation-inducible DNA-binding protein
MDFTGYAAATARMLLRPYQMTDFAAFHDLHGREDVARYLPWETRDEAASRIALRRHLSLALDQDDDGVTLAAFDKDTGRLVGEFVVFLRSVQHQRGEIGYVLHPDFWGAGLATEGARHLLDLAFTTLGLRRVVARLDAQNTASAAVLTRLGMRHEARLVQNELFKGEWGDEDQFAVLRSEWERFPGGAAGYPPHMAAPENAVQSKIKYTVPGISTDDAERAIALLQSRLHAHNDLHLTLKHVHWNVVGPHFIAVHEMIDPQVEAVRAMADDTAERIATLGGSPRGTPGSLVAERTWDDYSIGRATTQEHLGALDLVYRGVIEETRSAVEQIEELDPVTEDMLVGQLEKLELFHWFIRAHLENAGGEIVTAGSDSEVAAADAAGSTE